MLLKINEIFYSIQGEGPFAGHPAVFIRLSGCNETCKFCDTDHEAGAMMSSSQIMARLLELCEDCRLAVITGGEPLLQDFSELAADLIAEGFTVQVETNGSADPVIPDILLKEMHIVCSPKQKKVHSFLAPYIDSWKILVDEDTQVSDLPNIGSGAIYLQPVTIGEWDSKQSTRNRANAVKLCLETGYFLSMQLHKMLEVQ